MLERVTRTSAILLAPRNANHKKMLNVAIAVQRPIVETIRRGAEADGGAQFCVVFSAHEHELALPPGFPSNGVLALAREVTDAWKESTNTERDRSGILKAFTSKGTTAFSFFGRNMEEAVNKAARLVARAHRLRILNEMLRGGIDRDVGKTLLHKLDTDFREAKFDTNSIVYVTRDVTENIPDLEREMRVTNVFAASQVRNIGRRLSVGYSPIL